MQAMARTRAVNGNFKPNDDYEKMQFYYHPDHLGSSSYITNLDGEVSQHIEYVPFGEVFIEERNNTWNTPYLFNAKEFDEETGMYYYGARYYEPRLSLWMSTDASQEKHPNITTYCYAVANPIKFIDPDGNDIVITGKQHTSITLTTDLIDIRVNASVLGINWGGNYVLRGEDVLSAALDIVGIVDPTGVADGLNATLQAKNNDWLGAAISATGLIPYVGDLAKAGKVKKDVKIIDTAVQALQKEKKLAKVAKKAYSTSRPKYAKGQVEEVWNAAKKKNGKVYDPNTGEELIWDGSKKRKWDMGHKPGREYKKLHKDYMDGKISKEKFLKEVRNPDNYRPEAPSSNRSHKYEQK